MDRSAAQHPFCFCTVASYRYISQAAGLWASIQVAHPDVPLVVLAIDEETHRFFSEATASGIVSIRAEDAWGAEAWHNLTLRTNVPERAYASKAAVLHWIVASGTAEAAILVDSDSILLGPLDDLIDSCRSSDVLLVPTWHDIDAWRRSQNAGLFRASIVGFSASGKRLAAAWRAMCFDLCTQLPIDGIYNEQKYLEYLVTQGEATIVRDRGIDVSATNLNNIRPRRDATGAWVGRDGTHVRLFHASRTTDPDLELSKLKASFDRQGLERLGGQAPAAPTSGPVRGRDGRGIGMSPGRMFERAQRRVRSFFRTIMRVHRAYAAKGAPLRKRLRAAFREREAIQAQLWRAVDESPREAAEAAGSGKMAAPRTSPEPLEPIARR